MRISFSPCRGDVQLDLSKAGDVLTINGEDFDFSHVTEEDPVRLGDMACEWLLSDVVRKDGLLELTLLLPYGAGAPAEMRFPQPVFVEQDGPVALPKPV